MCSSLRRPPAGTGAGCRRGLRDALIEGADRGRAARRSAGKGNRPAKPAAPQPVRSASNSSASGPRAAIRNRDGRKAAVVGQGKDDIAARGDACSALDRRLYRAFWISCGRSARRRNRARVR